MTYKDKIRGITDSMKVPPSFTTGDWFRTNINIESLGLPVMVYLPERQGKLSLKIMGLREPLISIAYLDKIDFDAPEATIESVTEAMHLLALEWIFRASNSVNFFEAKNIYYEEVNDKLDVNVCGVVYTMELKERTGQNLCELL